LRLPAAHRDAKARLHEEAADSNPCDVCLVDDDASVLRSMRRGGRDRCGIYRYFQRTRRRSYLYLYRAYEAMLKQKAMIADENK
jgi:hypothetical protein